MKPSRAREQFLPNTRLGVPYLLGHRKRSKGMIMRYLEKATPEADFFPAGCPSAAECGSRRQIWLDACQYRRDSLMCFPGDDQ